MSAFSPFVEQGLEHLGLVGADLGEPLFDVFVAVDEGGGRVETEPRGLVSGERESRPFFGEDQVPGL